MDRQTMLDLLQHLHEEELGISRAKGNDYAGHERVLSNFLDEAQHAGITALQVWYVFFSKHLRSVQTFVRDGKLESESLRSRVQDMRLYLALLLAIAAETQDVDIWTTEEYLE